MLVTFNLFRFRKVQTICTLDMNTVLSRLNRSKQELWDFLTSNEGI